jgi:hypothetical protein
MPTQRVQRSAEQRLELWSTCSSLSRSMTRSGLRCGDVSSANFRSVREDEEACEVRRITPCTGLRLPLYLANPRRLPYVW